MVPKTYLKAFTPSCGAAWSLCQNQHFLIWHWHYSCKREETSLNADCMGSCGAEGMDLQPKFLGGRKSLHWEKTNAVLVAVVSRFGTCQNTEMRANNENMHLQLFSGVKWCLGQALTGYDPKAAETREWFWWCWLVVAWGRDELRKRGQILCLPNALSGGGAQLAGSMVWRLHLGALFRSWVSTPDPTSLWLTGSGEEVHRGHHGD